MITHLGIGSIFIAAFVPSIILQVQNDYPAIIVSLYVKIITIGALFTLAGLFIGFSIPAKKTFLSFDVLDNKSYENRVIKITKALLIIGLVSLIISYSVMGFVPMFTAEPLAAKFFRGQYQAPYLRVASLFRASFFILSTIIPISSIIWYKYKIPFFLFATLAAILLMILALTRSPAFSGLLLAFAVVMSFKSRGHFQILIFVILTIFLSSAFFYLIVGINAPGTLNPEVGFWDVIGKSSPDIDDQLNFLERFDQNPIWTYGRTIYGGLIPGHYEWNPAVYTLRIVAPDADINEISSGGLRLPAAMWGYVSFQWIGVIAFCSLHGFFFGLFLKYTKYWVLKHESIIIRTVVIVIFSSVFSLVISFFNVSIYFIPPAFVVFFYMYRFKISR